MFVVVFNSRRPDCWCRHRGPDPKNRNCLRPIAEDDELSDHFSCSNLADVHQYHLSMLKLLLGTNAILSEPQQVSLILQLR